MIYKIKKQKYLFLGIILMLIILIFSGMQFYEENLSYKDEYNKIKEYCYEEKKPEHEYCKIFQNKEHLSKYIKYMNPEDKYQQMDAITVTSTIVEHTYFSYLQYFSPLLIAIIVLGTIHSEFSSGMFENHLLRIDYKKYKKKIYNVVVKAALIMPIALIIIFIAASIFTNFNFDIGQVDKDISVYGEWKYNNFFLYGLLICLIQFFMSLFYANIAIYCCKKNKNKAVAIIMSYVMFILINLFIYIVLYGIIINNVLGFKGLTEYFNIAGFWFFNDHTNCYIIVLIAFLLQLISFAFISYKYKDSEKVILEYENKVS